MALKAPKIEQCSFGPWTVVASMSHMMSSEGADSEKYSSELKLPHLPEMVFPGNTLKLVHESGFGIEFNALDALRLVDAEHDLMKVACAREWQAARADNEFIKDLARPFDWTFTTDYQGTMLGEDGNRLTVSPTEERIDIEKLKQREKIHFYQDTLLYEDELSDNGCTILNVKIRVMPTSIFILQRLYVRVDGVMVRVNDTRIYHEAEWNYILREFTSREAKIPELSLPLHILTDKNAVWEHLPVTMECFQKLSFPQAESTSQSGDICAGNKEGER